MNRRLFLQGLGITAGGLAAAPLAPALRALVPARPDIPGGRSARRRSQQSGEFVFARLRYDSGDWDYNPKVCSNVLDSVIQYTTIPVQQQEVVITLDSAELDAYPFLFMTGHKLVRFNDKERQGLIRYVNNGGLLFSDDCNHDVNGLYAKSFEAEMHRAFTGPGVLSKIPNSHPLYHAFFRMDGPPQTSQELNGWGDNVVHGYLRGVERNGRLGVIYANEDYGCEWDYDWRNKRFRSRDNTKFAVNLVVYAMT